MDFILLLIKNKEFIKLEYYTYKKFKFENNLNYKKLSDKLSDLNLSIINKILKYSKE